MKILKILKNISIICYDRRNLNIYVIDYISNFYQWLVFYFVYNLVKKPLSDKYYLLGFVGTFVSSLIWFYWDCLIPINTIYNKETDGANYWDILSKNDYRNKKNPVISNLDIWR